MTLAERRVPEILDVSRKQRIAKGSGITLNEVNQIVKQFMQMRTLMAQMANGKLNPAMMSQMMGNAAGGGRGMPGPGGAMMPAMPMDFRSAANVDSAAEARRRVPKKPKGSPRKMAKNRKKKSQEEIESTFVLPKEFFLNNEKHEKTRKRRERCPVFR